jgi:hypothetical protein
MNSNTNKSVAPKGSYTPNFVPHLESGKKQAPFKMGPKSSNRVQQTLSFASAVKKTHAAAVSADRSHLQQKIAAAKAAHDAKEMKKTKLGSNLSKKGDSKEVLPPSPVKKTVMNPGTNSSPKKRVQMASPARETAATVSQPDSSITSSPAQPTKLKYSYSIAVQNSPKSSPTFTEASDDTMDLIISGDLPLDHKIKRSEVNNKSDDSSEDSPVLPVNPKKVTPKPTPINLFNESSDDSISSKSSNDSSATANSTKPTASKHGADLKSRKPANHPEWEEASSGSDKPRQPPRKQNNNKPPVRVNLQPRSHTSEATSTTDASPKNSHKEAIDSPTPKDYTFDNTCVYTADFSSVYDQVAETLIHHLKNCKDPSSAALAHPKEGPFSIDQDKDNSHYIFTDSAKLVTPLPTALIPKSPDDSKRQQKSRDNAYLPQTSSITSKQRRLDRRATNRGELDTTSQEEWFDSIKLLSHAQVQVLQEAALAAYPHSQLQQSSMVSLHGQVFECTLPNYQNGKPIGCTSRTSGQDARDKLLGYIMYRHAGYPDSVSFDKVRKRYRVPHDFSLYVSSAIHLDPDEDDMPSLRIHSYSEDPSVSDQSMPDIEDWDPEEDKAKTNDDLSVEWWHMMKHTDSKSLPSAQTPHINVTPSKATQWTTTSK